MMEWIPDRPYGCPPEPRAFIGLDLGQAQDPTALVVAERHGELKEAVIKVPVVKRYPLGTGYPQVVNDVVERFIRSPARTGLVLDGTGVGRAVVDLFLQHPKLATRRSHIFPVTITGGNVETRESGYWRVPKRNLVGAVQVLLQSQRLKIAATQPDTPLLVAELQNFKVTISDAGHDSYAAWREGVHDDLVLAAALAAWAATSPSVNAEFAQGKMLR